MPFQAARTITSISNSYLRVKKCISFSRYTGYSRYPDWVSGSAIPVYLKPEIRKPVSETAFSRHLRLIHIPGSDEKGSRADFQRLQKSRQVVGKMLTVRIDRDYVVVSERQCFFKSLAQGETFPAVSCIANLFYFRKPVQ